jgi:hypothetical protein
MKACPFCEKPVKDDAAVCPHCERGIDPRAPITRFWSSLMGLGCALMILVPFIIFLIILALGMLS